MCKRYSCNNKGKKLIRVFVTALRTLTIIPVPGKDTDKFYLSIIFFPFIGAFLGAVYFGLNYLLETFMPQLALLNAGFLLLALTVLTGALHADGLADTADAFFSRKPKEKTLEILKDSRLGTFGTAALVFDFLLKFILYYFINNFEFFTFFIYHTLS